MLNFFLNPDTEYVKLTEVRPVIFNLYIPSGLSFAYDASKNCDDFSGNAGSTTSFSPLDKKDEILSLCKSIPTIVIYLLFVLQHCFCYSYLYP